LARQDRHHLDQARDLVEEALHLARRTGDPRLIAACLWEKGVIAWDLDDRHGLEALDEGLTVATDAGDSWLQIMIRNVLAWSHYHPPSVDTARTLWETNLQEARRLGDDRTVAITLGFLSNCARIDDDPDQALRLAEEELEIGRKLGKFMVVVYNALHQLGMAAYCKGDLEAARAFHQQRADLSRRTLGPDSGPYSGANVHLGIVAFALGDLPSARRHLRQALSLSTPPPASALGAVEVHRALWGLGRILVREQAFQPAAVLLSTVEAAEQRVFFWIDPVRDPADHQHCLDLIAQGLTTDQLSQAQQQGEAMTLEQAIDYALTLLDQAPTS
jgi:tetratricopeptide (TPR) repeat protein